MSGTKAGGAKAAATNKKRYGSDWYAQIGRKGGSVSHPETRYFAQHPEEASKIGCKGGKKSSRKGIPNRKTSTPHIEDNDVEVAKKKKGLTWPFSRNAK